jgi:hypothetical protein
VLAGSLPKLYLDVGAMALYDTGTGTDTFTFLYRSQPGDLTTSLDWAPFPEAVQNGQPIESAFWCNHSALCVIEDRLGSIVNYTMNSSVAARGWGNDKGNDDGTIVVPHIDSKIGIDTASPKVVDVYTRKDTAPYHSGTYAVGEEIDVIVEFDLPVTVSITPPLMYLDLGGSTGKEVGGISRLGSSRWRFVSGCVYRRNPSDSRLAMVPRSSRGLLRVAGRAAPAALQVHGRGGRHERQPHVL